MVSLTLLIIHILVILVNLKYLINYMTQNKVLTNITISKKFFSGKTYNINDFIIITNNNSGLFDIENILLICADHYGPPFNPSHIFTNIIDTTIFVCNNKIPNLHILLVNTDIVNNIWCEYLWNKLGTLKVMKTGEKIK